MQEIVAEAHEEKETGRLEAFSDGVFAIAITLLVLELKVPDLNIAGTSPLTLGKALLQQWPSYVGLVTSFFTILIMWVHHHAILRNVCRTDARLHFANGCLLLGVTFVPYPTSVLASYWRRWRRDSIPAHLCSWRSAFICLFAPRSAGRCFHETLPWNSWRRPATAISLAHPYIYWRHWRLCWMRAFRWPFARRCGFSGRRRLRETRRREEALANGGREQAV